MPRNRETEPVETSSSTALTLPDDVLQDLLRAQRESIETPQLLPQIRVMQNGIGLFEFKDVAGETQPRFSGIVLNSHAKNVLWDHGFGDQVPDNEKFPACSAPDGKYGTPREGFVHEALGRPANGTEMIECATCPYNKFGTGDKLIANRNRKGKAVTNQRSVYILVQGRESPLELVLPSTSMAALDEYQATLLNRRIPIQAVVTEFGQAVKTKGTLRWGIVTFRMERALTNDEFTEVMTARSQYWQSITPPEVMLSTTGLPGIPVEDSETDEDIQDAEFEVDDHDDIPF